MALSRGAASRTFRLLDAEADTWLSTSSSVPSSPSAPLASTEVGPSQFARKEEDFDSTGLSRVTVDDRLLPTLLGESWLMARIRLLAATIECGHGLFFPIALEESVVSEVDVALDPDSVRNVDACPTVVNATVDSSLVVLVVVLLATVATVAIDMFDGARNIGYV